MFFNQYPYLNLNDLNLDYIMKAIKEMRYEVTNFVSINAIKYADPIQWNITSQYEKNTIVIDPVTGTAYISVAPVPAGVALTRPEYWTVVFDLGSFVTKAAQNFTDHYEPATTTTATFNTNVGEWLVWGDVLYKALVNITAGDTYVVDSNIEHFTIEDLYNAYLNTVASILAMVGNLIDLTTTDKTSIVNAINEIVSNIGDLSTLTTTDNSSIIAAINENVTKINSNTSAIALVNALLNKSVDNGISYTTHNVVTKFDYISVLVGASGYNMQGSCYNTIDNTILILFVDNSEHAVAVKVSANDGFTVVLRKQLDNLIGHGSDVTFNPTTNKYYVAATSFLSANSDDVVVVLNGNTLDYENTIYLSPTQVDANAAPSLIAYNPDDNQYIVGSFDYLRLYDDSFNLISNELYVLVLEGRDFGIVSAVRQGMIYKNGRVLLDIGSFADVDGYRIYIARTIVSIDYHTGEIVTSYPLIQEFQTMESEGIIDIDGVYYILSQGNRTYSIDKVVPQTIPTFTAGESWNRGAIPIDKNTDLDDLKTLGKYSTTGATTLSNAFTNRQSVIFVLTGYDENIIQIQMAYGGTGGGSANLLIFAGMRVYVPSQAGWSKWFPIGNHLRETTGEVANVSGCLIPCAVTNGSKDLVIMIPCKSSAATVAANLSITGGKLEGYVGGYNIRDIDDANPNNGRVSLANKTLVFNSVTADGIRVNVRNNDNSQWLDTNGNVLTDKSSFTAMLVNVVVELS